MKKIILLSLSLLISSSTKSHAGGFIATPQSSCSDIDFRNTFPLKMRDQGQVAWCYANAAADYLQYTFELPDQISAADIAIAYSETGISKVITFFESIFSKDPSAKIPQTGFIAKAIKHIRPEGYCLESTLPSNAWELINYENPTTRTLNFDNPHSSSNEILASILDIFSLQKQIKNGLITNSANLPRYYNFKNMSKDQFFNILKNNKQNKVLPKIRAAVCGAERKAFPLGPIKSSFNLVSKHIFQKINESFDSGMPSTIDFYSGIFSNYTQYKKKIDDLHTVLLYGRTFDPSRNECIYIMKNSFGPNCDQYDPKIKCENGYLFFPESDIFPTILSYVRLNRL